MHSSRPAAAGPRTPETTRADVARVALAGVAWGTGGLAGALLNRVAGLSPQAVASYRLLVGGLLVVAVLAITGALRAVPRGRGAVGRLLAIGALAATYQSCYFAAVSLTSVSLATLVTLGASPVIVVAADAALTRRRPSTALLASIALALAGLALLVGSPAGAGQSNPLLGCLLALGSATGFAAITLLGRRPVPGLDPVATTGVAFSIGGALLLPLAIPAGLAFAPEIESLALVLYLGLVPTAAAYILYFGGLRTVHAGPAALLALLEPLTAAVLGALLLGDRLGVLGIVGGLLIGAAVVLCRRH